ncbi:hypothetical protein BFJ68_g9853 [Fusarium oxysporum]|uniref:Phosphoinositide phospholipase C n=1 Tax=Fusarium oxysporum TaxID=5507 RepID=A0A420QRE8_FUSOX|nr:hypothetical protein BFJ68_g9853 [Fusarium oxysporum]
MTSEFDNQPRHPEQEELDMAGVKRVCQNLHIYTSQWTLQTSFRLSDVRRREKLNFTEFKGFIRLMEQRRDVQRINCSITAKPEIGMTFAEFLVFLRDIQGEDVDSNLSMWEKQFAYLSRRYRPDAVETSDTADDMLVMSEAAFVRYLTSETNSAIIPEPQNYTLDRPMDEYIISSSHNTYLLGRQVAGQSSVEGYISALIRGHRCVEIDRWDGNSGQPGVNHGHSLTASISFREVIATINKYAFVKLRFPLWIPLEVHCNPNQQAIMVNIMKEVFGSRLVTETLEVCYDKLPSPSELMERILIKEQKIAVDLHNQRYMVRVYPDRTRITSNNFDPLLYWRRGIQMVALNWQTFDLGMQINCAMLDGGQDFSGYVLKPALLRGIQVLPYEPELPGGKNERSVVSLTIDVISAQRLM